MDYYLKTTNKTAFLQDLSLIGIDADLQDGYYQDQSIIIDWIGQIPNPVEVDANGDIIGEVTYKDGLHVNIRSTNELDINLFQHTVSIYPETPYRIFS